MVIEKIAFKKIQEQLEIEASILEINQSFKDFKSGKFSSAEDVINDLQKMIKAKKNCKKDKI